MFVKAFIGAFDQPLVESGLLDARLVACDQQDRLASRVEGIGQAPRTVVGLLDSLISGQTMDYGERL